MEKIYSKIEKDKLLHIIHRLDDFENRNEIIPENNFIQCASLKMKTASFKETDRTGRRVKFRCLIGHTTYVQ